VTLHYKKNIEKKIAIISRDPVIAAALYNLMLAKTNVREIQDYPSAVFICAKYNDENIAIADGTVIAKKLGADIAVVLDREINKELSYNALPVLEGLEKIKAEEIADIREYLSTATPPHNKQKEEKFNKTMALIEKWADALGELENNNLNIRPASTKQPNRELLKKLKDPLRFENEGIIYGIGGLSAQSTVEIMSNYGMNYSGFGSKHDVAIIVDSITKTPNIAEKLEETLESRTTNYPTPLPNLLKSSTNLDVINIPGTKAILCDTAHGLFPVLNTLSINKMVNFIKEGMRSVPTAEQGKKQVAIVLATEATKKSGIIEEAIKNLGRNDIEIYYPGPEQQKDVNFSLWELIMKGKKEEGGRLLKNAYTKTEEKMLNAMADKNITIDDVFINLGCTEAIIGFRAAGLNFGHGAKAIDNYVPAFEQAVLNSIAEFRKLKNENEKISFAERVVKSRGGSFKETLNFIKF